ncbi:hypothetical protein E2493_05595 [Sphingomonas parva]|uniref:Secreted protein n=1 Tax=Sphingomonas parva TaxID=2555898 RepID=A0A4Y8ZTG9_9SPHN|nr:hypothetical protein [Sphingomonas parva]TFI59313.1 hypothetical protein E2493_05595 [Sphingomonas parva]
MARASELTKTFGAVLLAVCSTAALAEEAATFRCVNNGFKQDYRISSEDWLVREAGQADWKPIGCGKERPDAGAVLRIDCSVRDGSFVVERVSTYPGGSRMVLRRTVDPSTLAYSVQSNADAPETGACAKLENDEARPEDGWSLSRKLSLGLPFLLVTDARSLQLRPGEWTWPNGRWVIIEGKYHTDSGTWDVGGVGFNPGRTNSAHSCPPDALRAKTLPPCGGIHQAGYSMDRWYRPEEHDLVVYGRVYRYDEGGAVYSEGKRIGRLIVPDL